MTTVLNQREREHIAGAVRAAAAKAEGARGLMMSVRGTSITVTKRYTNFSVTYEKRPSNAKLELTRRRVTALDGMLAAKFRALALQAAVYKARELGWIV